MHLTPQQEAGAKRWSAKRHIPYPSLAANVLAVRRAEARKAGGGVPLKIHKGVKK